MGQYRQWLHYRHVDQQLQIQKDQIMTAVKHLQELIYSLDAPPFEANNAIMQALMLYMKTSSASPQASPLIESTLEKLQQSETISQALFDHSRLEMLQVDIPESSVPEHSTNAYTPPLPLIPHVAIDLIPQAVDTSSDQQSQPTQPQVALPWWLRKAALAEGQNNSTLDTQSIRTNRLVQRWLERWGRQEEQASQDVHAIEQKKDAQQEDTKL